MIFRVYVNLLEGININNGRNPRFQLVQDSSTIHGITKIVEICRVRLLILCWFVKTDFSGGPLYQRLFCHLWRFLCARTCKNTVQLATAAASALSSASSPSFLAWVATEGQNQCNKMEPQVTSRPSTWWVPQLYAVMSQNWGPHLIGYPEFWDKPIDIIDSIIGYWFYSFTVIIIHHIVIHCWRYCTFIVIICI